MWVPTSITLSTCLDLCFQPFFFECQDIFMDVLLVWLYWNGSPLCAAWMHRGVRDVSGEMECEVQGIWLSQNSCLWFNYWSRVKVTRGKDVQKKRKTEVERWRVDYHASLVDCPIKHAYHNVRGTHRYASPLNASMFAKKAQILLHPVVSLCSSCYFVILGVGLLAEKSREWSNVAIVRLSITCYQHLIV